MMHWIFTATMPVWICLVFVIALALLVVYMAFVAARNERATEFVAASKQEIIDNLLKDHEEARKTWDAQLADRNEALQEEKAKVKALHMQTVEIEEVKPEPAKRTTRKKAGQA